MKIDNVLSIAEEKMYKGASDIEIPDVYDNKIPKKKKMPKLKKGVYGVDSGDGAVGEGVSESSHSDTRYGFKILDVSSLEKDDSDFITSDEESDDKTDDEKDKSRKRRERHRADNLTRYLQYVTASD